MSGIRHSTVRLPSDRFADPASAVGLFPLPVGERVNCKQRYPKQSAVLDAIGTPCILRPDLRTSFLTYYGRGVNTAIRRYEFGYVFKSPTNCGGDSSYQYSASVDNVWLQPCESSVVFMQRKSGSVVGTLCLWEAVLLSCQLLKTLSLLLHKSLHLRLNHVGVGYRRCVQRRSSQRCWSSTGSWTSAARSRRWRSSAACRSTTSPS